MLFFTSVITKALQSVTKCTPSQGLYFPPFYHNVEVEEGREDSVNLSDLDAEVAKDNSFHSLDPPID